MHHSLGSSAERTESGREATATGEGRSSLLTTGICNCTFFSEALDEYL